MYHLYLPGVPTVCSGRHPNKALSIQEIWNTNVVLRISVFLGAAMTLSQLTQFRLQNFVILVKSELVHKRLK